MTTRISVDPDLCMGSGYCIRDLPALFAEEPDGLAIVREGVEDLAPDVVGRARRAALTCPSDAIGLHED